MPVCRESPSFPHASFEELPTPPPDLKAPAPGLAPLLVRDDTHTAWRIEWVTQAQLQAMVAQATHRAAASPRR